jgi:hypothetical protein
LAFAANAQDFQSGLVAKGIKAGVNMSNWTGNDIDNTDSKIGLAFGGFFDFGFSPNFGLEADLLYSQKGFKESIEGTDYKFKTDYLEIPLLLKYKFTTQGNFKPAIVAGPAVGILLSAKYEDVDYKDYFKSTDFGLAFGLSFLFDNQKGGGLTFDGRYTIGMSKIIDEDPENPGVQPDIKSSSITFLVGYAF